MARRRLNTILATTTLAAGMAVAPAWAQGLDGLTDDEAVTSTTAEAVEDTTGTAEGSTRDASGTLATRGSDDTSVAGDAPVEGDLTTDGAATNEDDASTLEVDDGAVTAGNDAVDVGSVSGPVEDAVDAVTDAVDDAVEDAVDDADAVEDAVDPAPTPSPSPPSREPDDTQTDTSSDSRDGRDASPEARLGGLVEGGGVTAAGGDTRAADAPASGPDDGGRPGRTVGESVAAFAAGNRGSNWSRGGSGSSVGSTNSSQIVPPRVAGPQDPSFERFPSSQVEAPTVLATPAATGDPTSPMAGLLKSLAALMLLGTGFVLKRTLDQA